MTTTPSSRLRAVGLRTEYLLRPLGTDALAPRFSWRLDGTGRNLVQHSYRVVVARSVPDLQDETSLVWDSGRRISTDQAHVEYLGRPLTSSTRYYWQVHVWSGDNAPPEASDVEWWETGLLDRRYWFASWIGMPPEAAGEIVPPAQDDPRSWRARWLAPAARLRRSFLLDKPVQRARVYATARGVYELHLNGRRIGDSVLDPGWTDYHQRIDYQTFDVTNELRDGANTVGLLVGAGWFSGSVGCVPFRAGALYGQRAEALAQLVVDHPDGTSTRIATDATWESAVSHLWYSDLLIGEWSDERRRHEPWCEPAPSTEGWHPVLVNDEFGPERTGSRIEPVRVTERIPATSMSSPSPGVFIYDFGQNAAGRVSLRMHSFAGRVRLRHGEVCNPDGTLYTDNLRTAEATDYVVFTGEGTETYVPTFTFHGFRYVEITGPSAPPALEDVQFEVLSNACSITGRFASSSPLLNRLFDNVLWSQRGNFLAVPTDCPQRDERLGWSGDAQVFARTAMYNMDAAAFFSKYMDDLAEAQTAEDYFPSLAPSAVSPESGAPGWADAGVIIPWELYRTYGDTRVIDTHWEDMERYVEAVLRDNPTGLRENALHGNFGDWLALDDRTDKVLIATAFLAYDCELLSRMATATGRAAAADRYRERAATVRTAFTDRYLDADGRLSSDTQAAYSLVLGMDLVPDHLRTRTFDHLVRALQRDGHLTCGFLGLRFLAPVLADFGRADLAYDLLLREEYPSWGYTIARGATTIWERWDGIGPDGGLQSWHMNSFNHYSLGSIGEWLYEGIAGIKPDESNPGFGRVIFSPHTDSRLTEAGASYESIRGTVSLHWRRTGSTMELQVSIPPNVTGTLHLPSSCSDTLRELRLESVPAAHIDPGSARVDFGSGRYRFTYEETIPA